MNRNTSFGRVNVAQVAGACVVLLLLGCNKPDTIGDNSGSGGSGGTSNGVGDAGTGGSTGTEDASPVVINLDVLPAWWGAADAPQGPEVPSTPTADSNCGIITSQTTRSPVDVLLVLDRSGSMEYSITEDCYCATQTTMYGSLCADTTNCTTRWSALRPAVRTTLSTSTYVNWGLKLFPSDGAGQNCTVNTTMTVPVAADSATNVASAVEATQDEYSTPTAAALDTATTYLKTLNDSNKKFILLATDGEPNCGGNPARVATDGLSGANTAAAAAYAAGFKVYVVGIGPQLPNLTQLAQNGGTTDFYPVDSTQALVDALSSISKLVGSCSFKSDKAPPDQDNVAVYVNGKKVAQDTNNGWTFGASPQEIVLTGDYCSQMSSGDAADVQILFGCPGQTNFPPTIY